MDKKDDKKVLDFFMDDGMWENVSGKKVLQKEEKIEKSEVIHSVDIKINKNEVSSASELTKNNKDERKDISEKEFGEVDYAILKSVTYGFKTIREIAKALQIRSIFIEKHIYKLIKDGYIKYFEYCVLTNKGEQEIEVFEKNNQVDVWKPINEFIESVIDQKEERDLKLQKMLDLILLILVMILIILIIYFGIFA